ncbi:MAG: SHOCT domain-containing protein [Rhodospirillales bacterium]|jgi:putative membrane protein|nr:hypothetical protein [Rhodospirillaceae bacterium]MDP6428519.1 SHOCT domain-containing protein [Rhodospirillales bacterium]MDP6646163.1 SHOCT domain-containing protein [Rhodospirillales bacterium]MDP6843449.1 SHOCT domain-containing protein [Rhodospirillales bacterium]|tara:strand:+ start:537 stop:869 length:333 start_codon:yes stop_codon:yes gene_type:complete
MKNLALRSVPWVFALLLPATAWANGAGRADGYGHMMGGWGGGMIFGPILMILFVVLIVVAIVVVVRWLGGTAQHPPAQRGKSALDILDERFARGEIDRDEYEDRKQALSG